MERTRRDVLGLVGASLTVLSAGCLDSHGGTPRQPPAQPSETPTDQPGGTPTDQPTETPTDPNGQLPAGLERVDEPPYDIAVPECESPSGSTPSERDPLYLCANMPAEPSLSFTQATTRGSVLADAGLELGEGTDDQMYVTLLTESADRVASGVANEAAALIRATDFETHAVLVVETGWGSGSVYPHIKRVEATDTGVHAFGCHSDPCVWTDDYTARTTAVRFERPDALETGVVSLTVAADERWNVAAGEGVVTIPSEE